MLIDTKQLQWLGIDLCSRERRRWAVLTTYVAFLIAVWLPTRRTFVVLTVVWVASMFSGLGAVLDGVLSRSMRRVLAAGLLCLGAWCIWRFPARAPDQFSLLQSAVYAAYLIILNSVLGWNKLVEPSGRGWMGAAVRNPERLGWWQRKRLARIGFAAGLDGFAWYEFGVRFRHLPEDRKVEVIELHRAHPRGKWMRPRTQPLFDDERMRHEDEAVRAQVQRTMSLLLVLSAMGWWLAVQFEWPMRGETMAAWLCTLAVISTTLRQAIVLWREEDPRAVTDELEVVQAQEA